MMNLGTIVTHSYLFDGQKQEISCSGLYLGSGFILTSAVILGDLIKREKCSTFRKVLINSGCISQENKFIQELISSCESKVFVHHSKYLCRNSSSICKSNEFASLDICLIDNKKETLKQNQQDKKLYCKKSFKIHSLFFEKQFRNELNGILAPEDGWKLPLENNGDVRILEEIILSSFVLLMEDDDRNVNLIKKLSCLQKCIELLDQNSINPVKGCSAIIESTPFGNLSPDIFMNTLSEGIISNTSGDNNCLFTTDARCVIGTEGAPVFCRHNKKLYICGIVIFPFCLKSGEWVGLTLVASAKMIFHSIIKMILLALTPASANTRNLCLNIQNNSVNQDINHTDVNSFQNNNIWTKIASRIQPSIVRIIEGTNWGTGIVVSSNPGVILTCAHVVSSLSKNILIKLYDGQTFKGSVVYRSNSVTLNNPAANHVNKTIWDICVITTSAIPVPAQTLAKTCPKIGTSVLIAGYGLFSRQRLAAPSVSKGIISKVIHVRHSSLKIPGREISSSNSTEYSSNQDINSSRLKDDDFTPVMIQTTCTVYPGCSGAPIINLDSSSGMEIVGIVVCNMRDEDNKASYPNINLAIPTLQISEVVSTYIETQDVNCLKMLDVTSSETEKMWLLGKTPAHKL